MSDFRDVNNELHWKKELTALRKAARVLRDPETTSSLRTPLSTRSVPGAPRLNNLSGTRGHNTGRVHPGKYTELDSCSPLKFKDSQKLVFLYNWGHPPSKSTIGGANLDGSRNFGNEIQMPGTPGDSSSDAYKKEVESATNLETSKKKSVKKSKRNSAASRRVARRSFNSKPLDHPSVSSAGPITSMDQSDDTGYCNSEDLRISTHDMMRKSGYASKPESPLLSRRQTWSRSSKLLTKVQREDSSFSCTPASVSSINKYRRKSQNITDSWDGTTTSFNGNEEEQLDLSRSQGCGIPCYWSKRTPKHRSCSSSYSPSLSDTLRRKGSGILCGSQTLRKQRSSRCNKHKFLSESSQGLPLMSDNCACRGESSIDSGESDDEHSSNFGELDLEALSRLDRQRWSSSCGSQEGLELVALEGTDQGMSDHVRSLSKKYSPKFFEEIIGQNIVVQSLTNAISRERIAPMYLFQGPHGTGKTSTARIFAAALNCVATEETKPCGSCRECTNFISGRSMDLREVVASNKKAIERVRFLLKNLSIAPPSYFSHYKVFIIEECHMLPTKTWSAFMKFLEEPPAHIVFIFITTDLDNLPRIVLSRCQKYIFNKIRDTDIVTRLKKLSITENLDFESHALHLITFNADGSLRDAETMLEQLSLLGKKITASLVNELVGVVQNEKLLDLLELAMSSNTAETVKRCRELLDSGVDPMALVSQLAGLIMDIIGGKYQSVDSKCSGSFIDGRSLTEAEVERLRQALKLLLEAEKQLRVSSERSTWFTAALLQLGSVPSPDPTHSSSSRKQSSKMTEEDQSNTSWEVYAHKKKLDAQYMLPKSTSSSSSQPGTVDERCSTRGRPLFLVDSSSLDVRPPCSQTVEGGASVTPGSKALRSINAEKLDDIWDSCIERCHSKTLRQLLYAHGRLLSISEVEGVLVAFIALENADIKSRVERFLSSITNSMETVMRHNVEVRLGLMLDTETSSNRVRSGLSDRREVTEITERESQRNFTLRNGHSHLKLHHEPLKGSRKSFSSSENDIVRGKLEPSNDSLTVEGNHGNVNEGKQDTLMQRMQAIIDEQRLESAWLQSAERGTPTSMNQVKPKKNKKIQQDDIGRQSEISSVTLTTAPSRQWEDNLTRDLKVLEICNIRADQKGQTGHYSISPSFLHNRGSVVKFNKENLGYESGTSAAGCNGLLCWKTTKSRNKVKVKPGTPVRLHRMKQISCFGQGGKKKKAVLKI